MITLDEILDNTESKYKLENKIEDVAGYVRKSRDIQNAIYEGENLTDEEKLEQDLKNQISRIKRLCEERGWRFTLYHEIKSGENIKDRPEMNRMLQDIREGLYDAVISVDYDRLSRGDATDQDTILKALRSSATLFFEESSRTLFNPFNKNDLQSLKFKAMFSNYEYNSITERFILNKRERAREGSSVSGTAPYGYIRNKKTRRLDFDKETYHIVKDLIFNNFLYNNMTPYEIAWELNKRKIPSPRNSMWHSITVKRILENEVYKGVIIYNKTMGSRKKKDSLNAVPFRKLPPEKWIVVNNAHDKYITEEEYERVKYILTNTKIVQAPSEYHPLHKLVSCYNCGRTMIIQKSYNNKNPIFHSCQCGENRGGAVNIVEETIDISIEALQNRLVAIQGKANKDKAREELKTRIIKLEKEITENEKAISEIDDLVEARYYTIEEAINRKKIRNNNINELTTEIKKLQAEIKNMSFLTNKEKLERVKKFKEAVKNKDDVDLIRKAYLSIIKGIVWKRTEEGEVYVKVNFL